MILQHIVARVNNSANDCANKRQMRSCIEISNSAASGKRGHQEAERAVDRGSDGQAGSTGQEGAQDGLKPADVHC